MKFCDEHCRWWRGKTARERGPCNAHSRVASIAIQLMDDRQPTAPSPREDMEVNVLESDRTSMTAMTTSMVNNAGLMDWPADEEERRENAAALARMGAGSDA